MSLSNHSSLLRFRLSTHARVQGGFTLFEVLIAALILAVAVAAVMRLHTQNLRNTGGHDELQRAYWIVSNAQQRFMLSQSLMQDDIAALKNQATAAGLNSAQIIYSTNTVGVKWTAWDHQMTIQRGGCAAMSGQSCIQVKVGK